MVSNYFTLDVRTMSTCSPACNFSLKWDKYMKIFTFTTNKAWPDTVWQGDCLLKELPAPLGPALLRDWFWQEVRAGEGAPAIHTHVHPGHALTPASPGHAPHKYAPT